MTIRELIDLAGLYPLPLAGTFGALPLASWIWGLLGHKDPVRTPFRQGYSTLVYLSCIPGMFSAVLVAYTLFFTKENLLDKNALVYLAPLASMGLTLSLIRSRISFSDIPGFGRLSALMGLLAASFALALAIDKTRIFVGFFGSIDRLLLLVGGIFAFLKVSWWMVFGRKKSAPAKTGT